MSKDRHISLLPKKLLVCAALLTTAFLASAAQAWDPPRFTAKPEAVHQAASLIKTDKDSDVTILFHEERVSFDAHGLETNTDYMVYRVETEDGVKGWGDIQADWEPWHEAKPEIRARVISADGTVHMLDLKTFNDVPAHENTPDTYSDKRAYGGPLPAIAVGAIVEQEVTTRDTSPFFAGGTVERIILSRSVPVHESRLVLSHMESLPLNYVQHRLPSAVVKKSTQNGIEIIVIENGRLEAEREKLYYAPSDVPTVPQVEFSTGDSWAHVAQEYARLSNDKLRLADVQPVMAKLKIKDLPREDAISKIVSALHNSVRYTGVEFGESSLIPQFPSETLKRKYGDCKDKAALLTAMLRAAGISAQLALLDTGPGRDVNPDLPGMGMFDHAIVYVPAAGSSPELWIDATANYSRVGDLPRMDYGRWALIVEESTSGLKKIPDLKAAQNVQRETREFALAEFGPAQITEKTELSGPRDAEYREYYDGDAKEIRDNLEKYVKREYLADSLASMKHNDVLKLEEPFQLTLKAKGKRGGTDYESATVAIRVEDLFEGLPDYFTTSDEQQKEAEKDDPDLEPQKPRTVDWQLVPLINEWNYRIVAPAGFKLRALPPSKEEQLGTARFSQKYTSNADGTVVEAILRFDTGKSRLTVEEAKLLRDAVLKVRKTDPIMVTFDQAGHALIASGKVKEGLAEYQQLAQLHPKEALHQIELARAFLTVGLGEKARAAATQATVLEPNSSQAFRTLGWILQHDLIGRHLKKGFDYNGALAAYRKAKQLAPKDKDIRADLAILLEYDANGNRYTQQAHLQDAIAEFNELKKLDASYAADYEENVLFDLWYSHDYKGVADRVSALRASDLQRKFTIAAAAAQQDSAAAIKRSLEITTQEQDRSKALNSAAWLLLNVHKYADAAELFMAGARGQSNSAQVTAFAGMLKKTKPKEQVAIDGSSPAGVAQQIFWVTLSEDADYGRMNLLMARNASRESDTKEEKDSFQKSIYSLHRELEKTNMTLSVVGDIAISNLRFSSDGTESVGYKVTILPLGAEPQQAFVVREDGKYKILEFSIANHKKAANLGWQALDELDKKNVKGARQWLDWAREEIPRGGNDDPLADQPFPHFWSKGQEGEAETIRTAALALISSKEMKGEALNQLLRARQEMKDAEQQHWLDVVIASAYDVQQRWAELEPVAAGLFKAYPDSLKAFHFQVRALAGMKRFDEWEKLVQERRAKHPDEIAYTRSAAELARYRGDFGKARQLVRELIDKGKAGQGDLNLFAWDALFVPGPIDHESIETAENANRLTKEADFSVMHTLACLYAQSGRTEDARNMILKAMDAGNLEEPDSPTWLVFAEIAEQYGELDAARAMYSRVEKPKILYPNSNYDLAQQRLASLKNNLPSVATGATR